MRRGTTALAHDPDQRYAEAIGAHQNGGKGILEVIKRFVVKAERAPLVELTCSSATSIPA